MKRGHSSSSSEEPAKISLSRNTRLTVSSQTVGRSSRLALDTLRGRLISWGKSAFHCCQLHNGLRSVPEGFGAAETAASAFRVHLGAYASLTVGRLMSALFGFGAYSFLRLLLHLSSAPEARNKAHRRLRRALLPSPWSNPLSRSGVSFFAADIRSSILGACRLTLISSLDMKSTGRQTLLLILAGCLLSSPMAVYRSDLTAEGSSPWFRRAVRICRQLSGTGQHIHHFTGVTALQRANSPSRSAPCHTRCRSRRR